MKTQRGWELEEIGFNPRTGRSGFIALQCNNPADPDEATLEDNFIICKNGTIAFDRWHDNATYDALCCFIRANRPRRSLPFVACGGGNRQVMRLWCKPTPSQFPGVSAFIGPFKTRAAAELCAGPHGKQQTVAEFEKSAHILKGQHELCAASPCYPQTWWQGKRVG